MRKDQNDKISSQFQTLVKMSSGKNPSTFTLPPELTCHTYFPGEFHKCSSWVILYVLSLEKLFVCSGNCNRNLLSGSAVV